MRPRPTLMLAVFTAENRLRVSKSPLPESDPTPAAATPVTATLDARTDNSLVSWSQGPDLLPLDLEDLEDVNFDVGFEDLINTDALLDGALSLPVALTPKPDQMLVPSRHHPQTSLEEMIASRIQYALDVIKKVPSSMVSENQTPWSHPHLYRACMPREMQDAQACCALYAAKNQYNAAMILRTIQARAHEVLAAPPPKGRLEALARLHAILLYQIIRIFDGDIPMRASAQQSLTALEPAMLALLPFVKWESSQPTTGPAEDQSFCPTKEFWQEWIWQESARRTIFFTCFFLITHQMLIGREPPNGCSDRYIFCQSWTMSAHLWGAPNVVDFAIAWREKKHFVINQQSFNEALRDASADDVDLFGRMLMVGALGIDDTRLWFYNRGGTL
ncbi:unnamed protein product [Colletotrichum noveboracense]|uniref:Transcription factor domain-containing protein n=1 Tax=Colletotrichum noveboracense TaxID=2664923 RepID=A0A9W4S0M0_9PEZI|nr:unnamed protein product [Colletotrichum noveboracense]